MTRPKNGHWSKDEIINTVAYLDYYVEQQNQNGRWSDDAVLSKIAKHIGLHSHRQIRQKLLKLRGDPNTSWARSAPQEVFKQGSRGLKLLLDEDRLRIRDTLKLVREDEIAKLALTPQLLRSGKERSASVDTRWQSPLHSLYNAGTPTKRPVNKSRKRGKRHRSRGAHTLKTEANNESTGVEGAVVLHVHPDPTTKLEESNVDLEVANSVESSPLRDFQSFQSHNLGVELGVTKRKLFELNDVPEIPVINYEYDTDFIHATERSKKGRDHEILRDLLEDNKYFRTKWLQLETEKCKQGWAERVVSSVEHLSKKPEFSMLAEIQKNQQTIAELKQRLQHQEHVKPFLRLGDQGARISNLDKIRRAFENFKISIYRLAEVEAPLYTSGNAYKSSSLMKLALSPSLFSEDFLSQQLDMDESQLIDISQLKVIARLLGSAVRDWIFMTDVRCAIFLSTPVHESLRHHLHVVCGEERARKLDLLAYQSIIHDKDFEETYIKRAAESFAHRFAENIREICDDDATEEYYGQSRDPIKNVFLHALTIKYELMLRDEKFKFIWPATGSKFQGLTMETYPPHENPSPQDQALDQHATVDVTLVPGFQAYPQNKEHIHDLIFLEKSDTGIVQDPTWTLKATVNIR